MVAPDKKLFTILTIAFYFLFILILGYWIYLNVIAKDETLSYIFTSAYCSIAFIGGMLGLISSSHWGGRSSKVGQSLLFLSVGLILQFAFQMSYTIYYFVLGIENPYPSIGDIFYVLGNFSFLIGTIRLYTVLFKQGVISKKFKILGFAIATSLVFTYITLYLRYVYAPEILQINSFKTIEMLFIDVATVLTNTAMFYLIANSFVTSIKYMGGVLRIPVLILKGSISLFYIADLEYTISNGLGKWEPAGIDDLLLFFAYTAVGLGTIKFKKAYDKLSQR